MTNLYLWLAAGAGLVVLYSARQRVLRKIGRFLLVNDAPPHCDAIVLLNGNISTRTYRAAALHRQTGAPILMARLADTEEVRLGVIPNISDATTELLRRRGVAADDIELLCSQRWVAGTWAEAILLCGRIRAQGYHSVVIVTDAFHTRRARWTFRKVLRDDDVSFTCAATPFSLRLVDSWWRSEYGLVQVFIEYIKLIHYHRLARAAGRAVPLVEADLPLAEPLRRQATGEDGSGNAAGDETGPRS